MSEIKSKKDKVTETIRLLKQVLGLGIKEDDPSYIIVKKHCSEWINSEEKKIYEHEVEFPRYERKAILTLPWKNGKSCEFYMRARRGV